MHQQDDDDDDDDDDDGNSPGGATGSGLFVDSIGRRVQNDPEPNRPHSGAFIAIGDDGRAMRVDTNPNAEDSGSQTTRPRADSKAEESKVSSRLVPNEVSVPFPSSSIWFHV